MIKCPNCTAQLAFEVTDQKVKCSYCGSSFEPSELNSTVKAASETVTTEVQQVEEEIKEIDATTYNCVNCGASLLVFDDTAVTFCNYCGSSNMIKSNLVKQTSPDYIIPFAITKEKCIELYKKKIKRNIFAPRHMLDDAVVENFRGIYMPYELYNYKPTPDLVCKGRKFYKRVGNYDYYHIYTIKCKVDGYVKGIAYDGVSRFHDKYSQAIGPYNFSDVKEFDPAYISGFYADSIDIGENLYNSKALNDAYDVANAVLAKDRRFAVHGCSNPTTRLLGDKRQVAMYPVYFLGMRDKFNKNIYYAVVNGQTGKVAIDIPIDYSRYIVVSLILAVLLFFVFQAITMDVFTPLFYSMGASVITFIYGRILNSKFNKHNTLEDDIGYQHKNKNVVRNVDKKFGIISFICPLVGFGLPLFVMCSNLASDLYFYGAAIISCALVLISFYDIVIKYNKLSKNKIPQLEKRGGDN